MLFKEDNSVLVVGIGNILRSDDGAGHCIAQTLEAQNLPNTTIITTQQLHLELLEEAIKYSKILLIDAASQTDEIAFRKIEPSDKTQISSSHHLSPELFVSLAKTIYSKDLNLYVCSIRAESMEVGDKLTPLVTKRISKAMKDILLFLEN